MDIPVPVNPNSCFETYDLLSFLISNHGSTLLPIVETEKRLEYFEKELDLNSKTMRPKFLLQIKRTLREYGFLCLLNILVSKVLLSSERLRNLSLILNSRVRFISPCCLLKVLFQVPSAQSEIPTKSVYSPHLISFWN